MAARILVMIKRATNITSTIIEQTGYCSGRTLHWVVVGIMMTCRATMTGTVKVGTAALSYRRARSKEPIMVGTAASRLSSSLCSSQ